MTRFENARTHPIETPSGKDASYENFPVGSFLLPKFARQHVATYYRFARTIDDIADSPALDSEEKRRRLDGFDNVLRGKPMTVPGYEAAVRMHKSLEITGVSTKHCLDLITAFKQDATKSRYATWEELVDYCKLSAAPVGRYLIELIDGKPTDFEAADALCIALQVVNHLQDCGEDYRMLDRVYLPQEWMHEAAMIERDLALNETSGPLRVVIDRCLANTSVLLDQASMLPTQIKNKRLLVEARGIYWIARSLVSALSRKDVLRKRVTLGGPAYARCVIRGMFPGS